MRTVEHSCRIAAIVPTYNRRDVLERCLVALLGQTRLLDQIIVVDNASTDGTQEMVESKFSQTVIVIRLHENTGSAGGFYEGIRAAYLKGHDWIWAMDNDAEPQAGALEELTKSPYFTNNRVGLLGSLIVSRDGTIQYCHSVRFSLLMQEIPAENVDCGSTVRIDAKSYAGALIHRRGIDAVGLPTREYFVYQDDLDYTYRMSQKLDLFLVPRSRVIHQSSPRVSYKSFWWLRSPRWRFEDRWQVYYTVRNHIYFITRNARKIILPLIVLKLTLDVTRKLGGILIFDDRKFHRSRLVLRATCDGFAGRLGKASWF